MREFKSALGLRGDYLYCPLPLYIDPYWTCGPECLHCYSRRLNRTWGNDFRAADPEKILKRLESSKGTSPLSRALQLRKAIRLGNRADPFQPVEEELGISSKILANLSALQWETVIQTRFPSRLIELAGAQISWNHTALGIITPGLERDWETLERKQTEHPDHRIGALSQLKENGYRVGINGEPFIPGYHSTREFRDVLRYIKKAGIYRYNTYNLHFNDLVAKNLHSAGIDIEKVWRKNQDDEWRKILKRLVQIADEEGVILGCPDFVNTGWARTEPANTCCGIDVDNPCEFNTHYFKARAQEGTDPFAHWEGIGDYEEGRKIILGKTRKMFTLKDVVL